MRVILTTKIVITKQINQLFRLVLRYFKPEAEFQPANVRLDLTNAGTAGSSQFEGFQPLVLRLRKEGEPKPSCIVSTANDAGGCVVIRPLSCDNARKENSVKKTAFYFARLSELFRNEQMDHIEAFDPSHGRS